VRTLIDAMEQSVEAGPVREAANFLHTRYADPVHVGPNAALRTLFGITQRHRGIHLLTVIKTIELTPQQDSAAAVVYVEMSGVPVESMDALIALKADLYRFDLSSGTGRRRVARPQQPLGTRGPACNLVHMPRG